MTFGELIAALERLPGNTQVAHVWGPISYRGHYDHVAFVLDKGTMDASKLLQDCRDSMGTILMGYKGGDYTVTPERPVWVTKARELCGRPLLGVYPELQLGDED